MTSGFIDLATYDEQEKYMYGGEAATAYFVRETRKSTWFTQVPVCLNKASGTPQFNQEWSVSITRAGDYLLHTWLRVTLPSVTLSASNQFGTNGRLRWTRNVMHALIRECAITFNDLVAARFDNYHLDFWSAFTTPAGKLNGYNNMIGSIDDLIEPKEQLVPIDSITLNLPLPFFFTRDSGVALPAAAIPYNDMRITMAFRDWSQLLILDDVTGANPSVAPSVADLGGSAPSISQAQVWANYAIVSNEERKRMGCAPRDILIEQVQTAPVQSFSGTPGAQSFDIRFSHAIKVLFFGVRNKSIGSEWSNYTAGSSVVSTSGIEFTPSAAVDPILQTSLIYENTPRLASMGSDYFSLVQPYYGAPVIPTVTGYHMYSYSLDFISLDPMGSTNYGKLTNVAIVPEASTGAQNASEGSGPTDSGYLFPQSYDFIVTAVNNNIIRISGGKNLACHQHVCAKDVVIETSLDKHCNSHSILSC
jgi:hypothetical protein